MNVIRAAICIAWACLLACAQIPEVRPQIAGRPVQEGQVTVVYLAPRFATAVRMPDAINSVVLGDPASFTAEHSEREPQIVFVKPITEKAAQTNLLISTSHGYQASLLLISQGEGAAAHPNVDFVMRYRPAGRFVIEPNTPSVSIAQTVALNDRASVVPTAAERATTAPSGAENPVPPPPVVATTTPAPPPPAHNDADPLKKSSLVFVANSASATSTARPASMTTEPALLERRVNDLLPNGSHLVARLQTAVSTAVKAPVVAAIEYNYERNGEIVVPAGSKAFGDLSQANRNGNVGIHFHTLQLPDGTIEKIDAVSMSLTYGPLKGSSSGGNAVKQVLVRSLSGVGTMAAYLVGGPGGFGVGGQLDNSVLLRERLASNAGLAGEQEIEGLANNQNIVVSVPGNTRFFIVLLEGSGQTSPTRNAPARTPATSPIAANANAALPSAEELQELVALKAELNRMYQQVAATRTAATTGPPQQQ